MNSEQQAFLLNLPHIKLSILAYETLNPDYEFEKLIYVYENEKWLVKILYKHRQINVATSN